MLTLVELATLFLLLTHLAPEIYTILYFPRWWMASILNFKVRMTPKHDNNHSNLFIMLQLVDLAISFVFLSCLVPEILHLMIFRMVDGVHIGFQGQGDLQTQRQLFQWIYHAKISRIRHFICPSNLFGPRDIKFYVILNDDGGHFEYGALAELAVIFGKGVGAHFFLKCVR